MTGSARWRVVVVEGKPGIAAPGIIRSVAVGKELRSAGRDQYETKFQLQLDHDHDFHEHLTDIPHTGIATAYR